MNSVCINDYKEVAERIPYRECEGQVFLITGANGFLASSMIDVLMFLNRFYLQKPCKIIAMCRNEIKARERFKEFIDNSNFRLLIQDVNEQLILTDKVDYIVHAASSAVSSDFDVVPVNVLNANVIGTNNLLLFAKKQNLKRFLFFSSGAVYGNIPANILDIRESDFFSLDFSNPHNCYAQGKRTGEMLCKAYWNQYSVPTVAVRISHTYGPGINLSDGRVFSDFVSSICEKEPLLIKGDGNDVRPFCYIVDALVAFFMLLFKGGNGEIYNMANSTATVSIKELAIILKEQAFPERSLQIICKQSIAKEHNPKKVIINTDKLEEMGWVPQIDIVSGFRRTVKFYEEIKV